MAGLIDYLPNADALLALRPEELGMILLSLAQRERTRNFTKTNFEMPLFNANAPGYPNARRESVCLRRRGGLAVAIE